MKFCGLRGCVDSGQHHIAWAKGDDRAVLAAGLWRDDLKVIPPVPVHADIATVVQEVPQVYPGGGRGRRRKRVDPNILVGIGSKSGWFSGVLAPNATYVPISPRKWKGTINGDLFLDVILKRLTPAELQLLDGTAPDYLLHNVIDAMGMVLWTQGRL